MRLSAVVLCGDWHAAEDIEQETWAALFRHWHAIAPAARRAYARTVMVQLAAKWHMAMRRRCESLSDPFPEPAAPDSPGADEIAIRLTVTDAITRLPARQRQAILLRYWAGHSTEEIARIVQVPAGTIRSDLTRASVRLRAILALFHRDPGTGRGCPAQLRPGEGSRRKTQ
jgi:RNA polymerase sigma factor (sigma-70 family)